MYRLVMCNKNYSSWSLRAWLVIKQTGIEFDEELIGLDQPDTAGKIRHYSHAGRVPILIDGDLYIWESLAIIEYLAERHPHAGLWPVVERARAHARAISAEMHAGFTALRSDFHMNIRRPAKPHSAGIAEQVGADIERICEIWRHTLSGFGGDGPFLFDAFGAADAMFAPVVSRLQIYAVEIGPVERAYMDAVLEFPAFVEWQRSAHVESWILQAEEVD